MFDRTLTGTNFYIFGSMDFNDFVINKLTLFRINYLSFYDRKILSDIGNGYNGYK